RRPELRPEYAAQIAALQSERTRLKGLLQTQRVLVEKRPLPLANEGEPPKGVEAADKTIITNPRDLRRALGTIEPTTRVQEFGPTQSTERPGPTRRAGSSKPANLPGEARVKLYHSLYRWKDEDGASVIDKTTGRLNCSYPKVYETIFVNVIGKWRVPPS